MKSRGTLTFIMMVMGITLLGIVLPWWVSSLWIILIAFIRKTPVKDAIFFGALSFGVVWGVLAWYMTFNDTAGIIHKTGVLLGGISGILLLVLTVVISAITGGLSGWFGSALNKTVRT